MRSLKVAVIGLGLMGKRHARGYMKLPFVELAAVCDKNENLADSIGKEFNTKAYTNYEQMLENEELDAIDITLPDNMHLLAIEQAMKSSKHIIVEKPMASTLEDAKKIHELAKTYDKVFTVGHILRFDPRYSGAHESVSKGEIGKPTLFYMRRNSPIAGPLHYKGFTDLHMHVMYHDIDAIQWILNNRIKSVFAKKSGNILSQYEMTDSILAMCTLDNGVIGCIEASWVLPETLATSIDDKMELIGTDGVIYTDSCDKGFTKVTQQRMESPDSRHWPELNGEVSGALYEELTSFVNSIVRNEPSIVSSLDGLRTVQVVDAIRRSIDENKEILIEE